MKFRHKKNICTFLQKVVDLYRLCRIVPRRFRFRGDARSAHATLGRGAALGAAGNQRIRQGSACGGCFGGGRKDATGAMPYQPLEVAARQQSGFLVDDTPHSQPADGVLGAIVVGQGRRAE